MTLSSNPRAKSSTQRNTMLASRRRFLLAFEEHGTIRHACRAAHVPRSSIYVWQEDPEFAAELHVARLAFAEMLEGLALERVKNPDKNRGSDVLLLGLLNANLPSKYRPQFAMSEDSARDLIIEWRKAAKEVKREEPKEAGESWSKPLQAEVFEILMRKKEDAPKEREEQESS